MRTRTTGSTGVDRLSVVHARTVDAGEHAARLWVARLVNTSSTRLQHHPFRASSWRLVHPHPPASARSGERGIATPAAPPSPTHHLRLGGDAAGALMLRPALDNSPSWNGAIRRRRTATGPGEARVRTHGSSGPRLADAPDASAPRIRIRASPSFRATSQSRAVCPRLATAPLPSTAASSPSPHRPPGEPSARTQRHARLHPPGGRSPTRPPSVPAALRTSPTPLRIPTAEPRGLSAPPHGASPTRCGRPGARLGGRVADVWADAHQHARFPARRVLPEAPAIRTHRIQNITAPLRVPPPGCPLPYRTSRWLPLRLLRGAGRSPQPPPR